MVDVASGCGDLDMWGGAHLVLARHCGLFPYFSVHVQASVLLCESELRTLPGSFEVAMAQWKHISRNARLRATLSSGQGWMNC